MSVISVLSRDINYDLTIDWNENMSCGIKLPPSVVYKIFVTYSIEDFSI